MKRILILPSVCLLLFFSETAFAQVQEYKVIKSCHAYYKPLDDLPDSVIAKNGGPKVDPDAGKGSYEVLPVGTRVRKMEGTYVYHVKVLTGLFKGRLLYVKTEFLKLD